MKPTLTILILLFLFGTGICSYAQEATAYEKTIDGTTYVFDTVKRIVENKENKITKTYKRTAHFELSVKETTPLRDEYEKIFSKQRAEELEHISLNFLAYCDSTGLIREIRFLYLKGFDQVQLTEIKALEERLKKYRVQLIVFYEKQEYYDLLIACHFRKLYKD